jgi:hypothetical protein
MFGDRCRGVAGPVEVSAATGSRTIPTAREVARRPRTPETGQGERSIPPADGVGPLAPELAQ